MITFSIFRAKSPRVGMTARSSPRGRSVIPRSDRQRKKKDKRQRERDPTRANPRARRTVLVERIDKTGAAKGNTLYMPTTFPKCSVQFFAATSAAGSLWRASEWLRSFEVDARAKQTRTCSLAYASLRASAYTCIHARAPLVRACVRCVRAPTAGSRRGEEKGRREARDLFARISMAAALLWPRRLRRMHLAFGIFRGICLTADSPEGVPLEFDRCFSTTESTLVALRAFNVRFV